MRAGKEVSALGFTLLELVVTVAIVAVLATVAVPGFQSLVKRNQLASDFNEISAAVHYARSQAVSLRRNVTVSFSGEVGSPWGVMVTQGDEVLLSREGRKNNVEVLSPAEIVFNSLGRSPQCSGGNCNVQVRVDGEEPLLFSVLLSGRIEKVESL